MKRKSMIVVSTAIFCLGACVAGTQALAQQLPNWSWLDATKIRGAGEAVRVFAPIQLPDGAMVDRVACHFLDNSTTSELAIGLYQITWGGNPHNFTDCGTYRSGVPSTPGWLDAGADIANNTTCRQAVDGRPKQVVNNHGPGTLSYVAMLEIPDPAPGTKVRVGTCSARYNTGGEKKYYNLSHFAFQSYDFPPACGPNRNWCPPLNKCVPLCNVSACEKLSDDGTQCVNYCRSGETCMNGACCTRNRCEHLSFPDPCR